MIFFCYAVNWNNIPQDMTYRYLVRCEKNATCYYDEVQYFMYKHHLGILMFCYSSYMGK